MGDHDLKSGGGRYVPPHKRNGDGEAADGDDVSYSRGGGGYDNYDRKGGDSYDRDRKGKGRKGGKGFGDRDRGFGDRDWKSGGKGKNGGGKGFNSRRDNWDQPRQLDRPRNDRWQESDDEETDDKPAEEGVAYSTQDIRNRPKPSRNNDAPRDWYGRPDPREHNPVHDEPEEEVFPPKKARTGINFDDYDKIPVERSGRDCGAAKKIERFSEAQLHDELYENVNRCGYDRPTPIQKHSIPIIRSGRDLMACAQTGSGKTAAFLMPAIQSMLDKGPPPRPQGVSRSMVMRTPMPIVLVLAPTRELVSQIFEESRKFSYKTGIRTAVVYGGAPFQEQKREVMKGVDILVAAPGRLTHMQEMNVVNLGYTRYLVLDEADRMLDMGFEPQVRQIVEETNMGGYYDPNDPDMRRQTMMFSATWQDDIQFLAREFLNDYVFLTVGRVGSTSDFIDQKLMYAPEHEKLQRLRKCVKDAAIGETGTEGLALVFVETKKKADLLERDLWRSSIAVTAIHGDRDQSEREEALAAFRSGQNPILVATDVAARGLDIPNVSLVVNYDMPKNIDDYVHRIGRTGRAGRKGTAIAFVNEDCGRDLLKKLNELLVEAKQDRPDWFEQLAKVHGGGGNPRDKYSSGKMARDMRSTDDNWNGARFRDAEDMRPNRSGGIKSEPIAQKLAARKVPTDSYGASGADDAW